MHNVSLRYVFFPEYGKSKRRFFAIWVKKTRTQPKVYDYLDGTPCILTSLRHSNNKMNFLDAISHLFLILFHIKKSREKY